jgi:hypothetical protein
MEELGEGVCCKPISIALLTIKELQGVILGDIEAYVLL